MGELWLTVVVCGEDLNPAWVNHKGVSVLIGGTGGMGARLCHEGWTRVV